ncbi:putative small auxin-up RNA [Rosa chinensis]|uniref:Putative small auxin-up RNA n=1 Tax=Rosa chinensis TaxID=74649 RepID=A0A2P6RV73_ROSCH|nr:auxin-responsive protein SAUR68 [Rosa chinensis]PRQ50327.1 putative small auxin-up RNA [Rosa chinensis]
MDMMLSPKKLIKLTRKIPVIRRKKNSYPRAGVSTSFKMDSPKSTDKGAFVIYTLDQRRFVLPLSFLCNYIFQELFKIAEEEFGIPSDGPIVVPCDSLLMNYIVSLVQLGMSSDLEKAILNSIIRSNCSISTFDGQAQTSKQLLLFGY